ncbi:MAG: hypothetical protein IT294_09095 [Deltaproteobacteria bacterium]|nr:hypothetical protein [Deltaproteobacteria bacterium]
MTAVEAPVVRPGHCAVKRLRIARRRVARWFRRPEAELLRRQHPAPHPFPFAPSAEERKAATDRRD